MTRIEKPFAEFTAADLMSRNLVTVDENTSLSAAAQRLKDADLRGAPVINAAGDCVGVVTTTDFLQVAISKSNPITWLAADNYISPWQMIDPKTLPTETVARVMSKGLFTVEPQTPIAELVRMMINSHVHRLIVVEDKGRLVGIVSATDLLDALADVDKPSSKEVSHVS